MKNLFTVILCSLSIFSFGQTQSFTQATPNGITHFTKMVGDESLSRESGTPMLGTPTPDNPAAGHKCATHVLDSIYRATDPEAQSMIEFEKWMDQKIEEKKSNQISGKAPGVIYTIPVIVHIVHNGEAVGSGRNISQAQVQSQIDVLNEDFRRMVGTPGYNTHADGADVEIEFCMALVDELGNTLAEPGINRINRSSEGFTSPAWTSNYVDNTIKPATQWDPTQYFNMWVCDISGGILGWAQFPSTPTGGLTVYSGGAANTDGVVIGYRYFGSTDKGSFPVMSAPYDKGRTATHEVGHCLGLHHIWGDGGCSVDDYCNDTPLSDAANYGCANTNSCNDGTPNPADMVENYMDYSDDDCMNIFTNDQAYRMVTIMENSPRRVDLLSSTVCQASAPPTCSFTSSPNPAEENQTVTFTDATSGLPDTWAWQFPGATSTSSSSQNPSTSWTTAGTYNVTLTASNAAGSCTSTETITVTVPPAPTCNFSFSPNTPGEGSTVTFTDNSTGTPTSWLWEFESGTPSTSTSQNPTASWATAGTYNITLTATNASGSCSTTQSITVITSAHCDTLGYPYVGSPTIYGATGGYVVGWNGYSDLSKAEMYSNPGSYNVITGMLVWIGAINDNPAGSPDATVDFNIWDNSGAGGLPGNTPIATNTVSLADLNATIANSGIVQIDFFPHVTVTGDFYAGISMNDFGSQDSLGIVTNTFGDPGTNGAYEQWDDGTWYDVPTAWGVGNVNSFFWPLTTDAPANTVMTSDVNSICEGESIAYDGTGSTNTVAYTWLINGGTPNTSSSSTQSSSYATAGTFQTYLITDGYCGSYDYDSLSITVTAPPSLSTSVTDEACGLGNGSATAIPTGGSPSYSYNWSSGGTSQTEGSLSAGTVNVTVTDSQSCSVTGSATIGSISAPTASITSTNENCGTGNGTATAIPSGGTAPYSYNWSSGGTSQTENNLSAGLYSVTITDANTCNVTASVSISNSTPPSASTSVTNATCGSNNGTATAIPSGGTGGYTYEWPSGGTSQTEGSLGAGSYTVTVTDAAGCTVTAVANISSAGGPTGVTTVTDATCGSNNGEAGIAVTGGSSPLSYNWSSGGSSEVEPNLAGGTYTVTVTDASSCAILESVTVGDSGTPSASITVTDENCGLGDGTATAIPSGGAGGYSYAWSSGGSTANEGGLSAGAISVTITDANTCTVTASSTINSASGPTVSITITDENCGLGDGTATAIPSGGTAGYTYSWSSGGSASTEGGLSSGTISVTITDSNTCTASNTATINNAAGPSAIITVTDENCGSNNGTATAIPTGGAGGYTYTWSSGGSTVTEGGLSAGPISVTITDSNSCTTAASSTINSTSGPSISVSSTDANCGAYDGVAVANVSGGTSPLNYIWDDGDSQTSASATGLSSGTYNVTVVDNNGCSSTQSVTVGLAGGSPKYTVSITTPDCNGPDLSWAITDEFGVTVSSGTIGHDVTQTWEVCQCGETFTLNAPAGTTGPGPQRCTTDISPGSANVYDENMTLIGSVTTDGSTIDLTGYSNCALPCPTVSTTVTEASCGGNDGTATAIVSGGNTPFSYNWSSGGSSVTEGSLSIGTYTVTVTDAAACNVTASAFIINSLPLVSVTTSDATCGNNNGSATANASAGNTPYTYNWSSGGSSQTENGLGGGSYSVTVTDALSCTAITTLTINNISGPTASISSTNETCGNTNGSATVSPSDGTLPYSYNWSSGSTSQTANGISSGVHSVTVTDANSCTTTQSVTLSNVAGPTTSVVTSNASCGGNNGTATAIVTGGTSPLTYNWSNGGSSATIVSLFSGSYSVTVTDNNSCQSSASGNVSNIGGPTASVTSTDETCSSGNGSITVSATGGSLPYTYNWSSGGTGTVEGGLSGGTYTVTVSDAGSCNTVVSGIINNAATPTLTTSVTDATCGFNNGSATVIASGGSSPLSYLWSSGGTAATEGTLNSGGYSVTVTDANSCIVSASVVVNNDVPGLSITSTNAVCGSNNGTATAVTSGGSSPFNYAWSSGGSNMIETGLGAGSYTVTVTDASSCIATSSVSISDAGGFASASISTVNSTCGNSNGEATATSSGGTLPLSYIWSSGGVSQTVTGIPSGSISVTITDVNSCSVTASSVINNTSGPNVNVFSSTAHCGQSDGSANANAVGGTFPYSYVWSNGAFVPSISNLYPGTYSVTVSDASSCTVTQSVIVSNSSGPSISASTTPSTCSNANGGASVSATGGTAPYSYFWSTGGSTNNISGVVAGNYSVTLTDNFGCIVTTSVPISDQSGPSIAVTPVNSTCGSSNGSATVNITGGSSPYNYNWSSGGSNQSETGLGAGNYYVTVTDNNSCSATTSFLINTTGITVTSSFVNETCSNSNGSASVTVTGGTNPINYSWTSGGNSPSETGLTAGAYEVTITDNNGCIAFETFNLNNSPGPIASVTTSDATCGSGNGIATAIVTLGTSPFNYLWSTGGTSATESGLTAGVHGLTVTDANSCIEIVSFGLNNTSPTITTTASSATCGNNNGSALVSASGGTIPYSYNWSSGGSSAVEFGLGSGSYTVTVSDASGCISMGNVTIGDTPTPILTTTTTDATCGNNNGSATVIASGASTPYSYLWSTGVTTPTANNLQAGNYIVIVTDDNGCSSTANATVSNPGNLSASVDVVDASCGLSNGSASVSVTGGTSPYTIAWSPGGFSGSSATGLSAGNYTATIFDANLCVYVSSISIANVAGASISVIGNNETCTSGNGSVSTVVSGGSTPYSYSWSNGATTSNQNNISAGGYSVTVIDGNGCQAASSISISNVAGPIANINTVDAFCGQNNGSATAFATGGTAPISYSWSNGTTSNLITGLTAGTYTVTISDGNGCDASISGIVADQSGPSVATSGTNETCSFANGTGTAVVNGGTAPFVYAWSSGGTNSSISNLNSGTYSVTVIDNNGCSGTSSFTIVNVQPEITITSNDANCDNDNGNATASVSGGVAPYSYIWNDGTNSANISNLSDGTYSITVVDGNSCITSQSVIIDEIPSPSISVSVTSAYCDEANGTALVSATGGSTPYNYSWSGASGNTNTQNNLSGGTYSVFVTDDDGCMKSTLVIVGNFSSPTVTITGTNASCDVDNGAAFADSEGGTGTLSYDWSNGDIEETTTGLSEGTYEVTVSDANNCIAIDTVEIIREEGICLEIPSGFSPNGDNVNDYWNIYGAEYYSDITVEVYNRWGSLLFESTGYNEPWTGLNSNGKEVPAAVYYYIVILGDETRTGTVTIKR